MRVTRVSTVAHTEAAAVGVSRAVTVTMPSGSVRHDSDRAACWRRAMASRSSWRCDHAAIAAPSRPAGVDSASETSTSALSPVR